MKLNIKTILYLYFCFSALFSQEKGKNYDVFNRLINETKIEEHYSINEIRTIFESPSLKESQEVIKRFNKKPEKIKTYEQYKAIFLTEERLSGGVNFYFEHKELLNKIMVEFDIDPLILVSIVGIETNYGKRYAEHSVFNSLYTQTINFPKRSAWATKEIFVFPRRKKVESDPLPTKNGTYAPCSFTAACAA